MDYYPNRSAYDITKVSASPRTEDRTLPSNMHEHELSDACEP